jgi:hypothetical protein
VVSHTLIVALLFPSCLLQQPITENLVVSSGMDLMDVDDDDDDFSETPRARDTVLVPSNTVRKRRLLTTAESTLKILPFVMLFFSFLVLGSLGTKGREHVGRSHTRRGESGNYSRAN